MASIRTRSTLGATSDDRGLGLVAALRVGDLGADVAGAIVAVGGHGDEQVGPQLLGGELVLDEQLARQVEHPGRAQAQAGDVDRLARLAAAEPDQVVGRLGPLGDLRRLVFEGREQASLVEVRGGRAARRAPTPSRGRRP